jgi:cytoskeleton protein RodZ
MTEDTNAPDGGGAAPTGARATSAGALLREARQAQGLHIAALAAAIKVTPRKLEALEADRYDELPDITFTRALAQAVCRALKIDAEPVLERLPSSVDKALEPVGGGLNTPLRERAVRRDSGERSGLNRPVAWGALLLLAAAVAVFLLPAHWRPFHPAVPGAASNAGEAINAPQPTPAASTAAVALPTTAPVASTATPSAVAPAPTAAGSATLTSSTAGVTTPSAAPATPVPAAASAAGTPVPSATTSGDALTAKAGSAASWLSVRDARGRTLISRTLQPGESVTLDGTPPLRVTVGNAAALQLSFHGQAVALPPHDTVARLELK